MASATKAKTGNKGQRKTVQRSHAPGDVRVRLGAAVVAAAALPVVCLAGAVAFQLGNGSLNPNTFWLSAIAISGAAILLAFVLGAVMVRSILRQVDALSHLSEQLIAGNLRARGQVPGTGELATLGSTINAMLDEFGDLVQSRDERTRTEAEIKRLMAEVTEVASGDLTIEAQVGEGVTGGVADAINFMVAELRELIANVVHSTTQVSGDAKEILVGASSIASGSEDQATRIAGAANEITNIATAVLRVASKAEQLAERAVTAIATSKKGSGAVQSTIEGMNRIRENAQETTLRIKRLGEGSQEIGEIVSLIGDIADRTSTLALNASIQSAAAGEAGRGFAVVAEEVERLAVRSAEATREIDALIRRIQNETKDAVTAVEESTREIVEGSRLANEAGQTLTQVESLSEQVGSLLREIAREAREQATECGTMVQTMGDLSTVSKETAGQTRGNADIVETLAQRSDQLRESVGTFRLPN